MTVGRNDPCPCGSGRKYKKCCGRERATGAGPASLAEAVQCFQRGDFARTVMLCQSMLAREPANPDANSLSGLAWLRRGDLARARTALERAARAQPANADTQTNLALVLHHLGELGEAETAARRALGIAPGLSEAHNNLANILKDTGRLAEAIQHYGEAVTLNPTDARLHGNLGSALHVSGRPCEAEAAYRECLARAPGLSDIQVNLGLLLVEQERFEEAEALLGTAERISPNDPRSLNALAVLALRRKHPSQAIDLLRRALALEPTFAGALGNLGVALEEVNDTGGAVEAYRRALAVDPNLAGIRRNLVKLYMEMEQAELAYPFATEFLDDPEIPASLIPTLVSAFQQVCDFERQDRIWARFIKTTDSGSVDVNVLTPALLPLNYPSSLDEDVIFKAHRRWGQIMEAGAVHSSLPGQELTDQWDGSRRLRIGYLSPDMRRHSVGYFLQPIVASHDPARIAVACYSNSPIEDDITDSIRNHSENFRNIYGQDDATVARIIRDDGIDILIDLAGHTTHSRISVLARCPAPLQMTYLGYPNTTGARFIDYWITDPHAHAGHDEWHTERLLRLPESFLCFGSFEDLAPAAEMPVACNGRVTFGSFNNLAKLSLATVRLWSRVLQAVPDARLLLKTKGLASTAARRNLTAAFHAQGVASARLDLRGSVADRHAHMALYRDEIDIALDPVPYNGTTTTCEALWMGVPVVTWVGPAHRQRVSYSILRNIGVETTIARTEDEYVKCAVELARNSAQLRDLRLRVYHAVRTSILCEPAQFTRGYEAALAAAWQQRFLDRR